MGLANQGDGRFDRHLLIGATIPQYPAWVLGTAVGVLVGDSIGDPAKLGLDALYPAFFLALLVEELDSRTEVAVAAGRRRGGAGAHARRAARGARARGLSRRADRLEARMTDVWITIGVLAVVTAVIKAAGPVAVGGRELSPPAIGVISLLAPAVLAALVVVGTFAHDRDLMLDARAIGLAAAAATAIALRGSLVPGGRGRRGLGLGAARALGLS